MVKPVFPFFLAVLALVSSCLLGCEPELAPQLISVSELTPREAEVGDRLEILGTGFPQGKPARVSFRGTLYRPGESPARGAVVDAAGLVAGRDAIEIAYTEALDGEFCGLGDHRRHTTFEGDVEVSFAAASPGAPPVTTTLHQVTLDLRPPEESPSLAAERMAEGERTLAAMGIRPSESPPERGILVKSVDPGSRAEEGGILADDVLVAFAGVRVGKLSDVLLPKGRDVEVTLRRGANAREEKRTIGIAGVSRAVSPDIFGAAFIVIVAIAIVLLFLTPSRGHLVWLERRFGRGGKFQAHSKDSALQAHRKDRAMITMATSLLFALVPLVQHAFVAELDAPTIVLALLVSLVTLAILTGGPRRILAVVTFELPVALAVLGAVSAAGSLRLRDIVSMQGGVPWDWMAFRSPPVFFLFLLFFAAASRDRFHGSFGAAEARRTLAAAEHFHLLALAGLGAVVFLGGWKLPMLAPGAQRASAIYAALGSVFFLVKVHALAHLFNRGRRALSGIETQTLVGIFWRRVLPVTALALGASLMWGRLRIHPELEALVAVIDVVLMALLVVRFALRARADASSEAQLNPFL